MLEVSKCSIFKRVYRNTIKHSNLSSSCPTCFRSGESLIRNALMPFGLTMLQQMLLEKHHIAGFRLSQQDILLTKKVAKGAVIIA